jgi:ubiquinone/menaquinone biosynthesis C-methylase UbiE
MRNKEKTVKEQYEAWALTYDKDKVSIIKNDTGIELGELVNFILDSCHLQGGQNILDVGIGTGLISMAIAKRLSGKCKILGIDITDVMLKKAEVNIENESLGGVICLKKASAENIPANDNLYDLIVCVFTIRHTNIKNALNEFIRVLKPKGRVVIVDLYAPEKWKSLPAKIIMPLFKLFFMRKKKMGAEKESKLFTLEEWKTLITEMGGINIQILNFPNINESNWKPGKMIISWNKS